MRTFPLLSAVCLGAAVALTLFPSAAGAADSPNVAPGIRDGSHDFDFLYGKWNIHNRVLNKNPDGTSSWEEFDATNDCHGLPDGLGNEDYFRTAHWKGFVGMSIRLYDHDKGLWSIYWAENDQPGIIQTPPVVGSFKGNVGTFLVKQENHGKPYMVRFMWTVLGKDKARWEQAVSKDEGKTWETGWIMDFTRDTNMPSGGQAH